MCMAQNNNELEIVNDFFYIKKESGSQPCKYAYLHLSEQPHDIYVAFFENSKVEEPTVYWWEEKDYTCNEESRHFINVLICEAYISLYIKNKMEKPKEYPLWNHMQHINCGIPSSIWLEKIKNIKR